MILKKYLFFGAFLFCIGTDLISMQGFCGDTEQVVTAYKLSDMPDIAIQNIYDNTPSEGIINIAQGEWPSENGNPIFPDHSGQNKTVLWRLAGNYTKNGKYISRIGSEDVTESYYENSINFSRSYDENMTDAPILRLALDNYTKNWSTNFTGPGSPTGLELSAFAHEGANGNTVAEHIDLYSAGMTGGRGLDQGIGIGVNKYGTNGTWQIASQTTDFTYAPPVAETWGWESDIMANGDDVPESRYNSIKSNRVFLFLSAKTNQVPPWKSSTYYDVRTPVSVSVSGNCQIFTVMRAGITGSDTPIWDARPGYLIKDGSVIWTYGTSCQNVVGSAIEFTADDASRYDTGISSNSTFDNAVIDVSMARNNPNFTNGASFRIREGMPVDWSGNGTEQGKNRHVSMYSDSEGWLYKSNGNVVMALHDDGSTTLNGNTTINGTLTASEIRSNGIETLPGYSRKHILEIRSPTEGMIVNDNTDHVPVIYEKGHWVRIALGEALQ